VNALGLLLEVRRPGQVLSPATTRPQTAEAAR
jgi:hypothetical protein